MPPVGKLYRSNIAGNRPTGRAYGEPYVNVADGQFGAINAANAAQDLIGVRNFLPTANYAAGDAVLYNGEVLSANKALTPAAFAPVNFTSLRQRRNRLINGNCVLDQINWGNAVTCTPASKAWSQPCDRWWANVGTQTTAGGGGGSITTQAVPFNYIFTPLPLPAAALQNVAGLVNCLTVKSNAAYSIPASNYACTVGTVLVYSEKMDFAWGGAQAQPVTLSFMVYASQAGTWSGALTSWGTVNPPTGTQQRVYPFTYTVPTANTWTQIAITIPGDTGVPACWQGIAGTQGPCSIYIVFDLGSSANLRGTAGAWATFTRTGTQTGNTVGATGANSLVTTNGATWAITNVQLELGSIMSPFDYPLFEDAYQQCQLFYQTNYPGYPAGSDLSATHVGIAEFWTPAGAVPGWGGTVFLSSPMWDVPSVTLYTPNGDAGAVTTDAGNALQQVNNIGYNSFWGGSASPTPVTDLYFYYVATAEAAF